MKPLIILLISAVFSLLVIYCVTHSFNWQKAGTIAMAVMLGFTALGHFKFKENMAKMIPNIIPARRFIVVATGLIEIAAAVLLLFAATRVATAWFLIIFFILLLPANIYGAVKKVNLENDTIPGNGIRYLWFRIPLQFFFMAWIYGCCLN